MAIKNRRVHFFCDPQLFERIQQASLSYGCSLSQFIRETLDYAVEPQHSHNFSTGWKKCILHGGDTGAVLKGSTRHVPANLLGKRIQVQTAEGDSFMAVVSEVLLRTPSYITVRFRKLGSLNTSPISQSP